MQIGDLVLHLKEIFPGLKERSATDIIKFALQKQIPMESNGVLMGGFALNADASERRGFLIA